MESLTKRQFEVLMKEYDLLQSRIRDYDARVFQIKGWSTTIFSAALGLAILQNKPLLLLVPLFACFIFWGLDALFKSFQHIMIERAYEVEAIFNGNSTSVEVGLVTHSFERRDKKLFGRIKRVGKILFLFNVMALYIGKLVILSVVGFVLLNGYA